MQEGIGKAKGEDFYSEKYKSAIKKEETYVAPIKKKISEKKPNELKFEPISFDDLFSDDF